VWAIRTSTDGDDSFVELFDAEGNWLATGTGGFAPDPDVADGFVPTIAWDAVLGAEREGLAPRDLFPEIAAMWAGVDAAVLDGKLGVADARAAAIALVAGPPTTEGIDGHERAALRRVLADRGLGVTAAARAHLEAAIGFYRGRARFEAAPTTPAVGDALGLPAALATRVRLVRADLGALGFAEPGISAMSQLGTALATLPSAVLPSGATALADALEAAGATAAEADEALARLGADDPAARIFAGQRFHVTDAFEAVLDPGTTWLVASPSATSVAFLAITP
jgi:hypothetical protein